MRSFLGLTSVGYRGLPVPEQEVEVEAEEADEVFADEDPVEAIEDGQVSLCQKLCAALVCFFCSCFFS